MEIQTKKKCIYCLQSEAHKDSNFCSQICLELWLSLKRAKSIKEALDIIFDEHSGVKNANARPS